MQIHVVRHTQVNVGRNICYGQHDVGLANTFLEEANIVKDKLLNSYDIVYCSPLNRCVRLAQTLNLGNVEVDNNLKEINFGNWENTPWDDLDQEQLNAWMNDFVNIKPPKGENLIELNTRISFFLSKLKQKSYNNVLIITHAGPIRCLNAIINTIYLKDMFNLKVAYGEVFKFEV